ncbi:sulfite exporter TauE/SafE family protein [Candidatus Kaiserbacteria bacterium]|nr:MAG: sulfite exporter TauE/SafE family protein [Candidatus Kaiserbacteria bacterium]
MFREYIQASLIAGTLICGFVFLQSLGLVHLVSGGEIGYGAIFMIGVIASLSTCMAVVGGIVLTLSATFARAGGGLIPQFYFHVGRLVSFFILGGVIGLLGQVFTLTTTTTFVLNLLIGMVMLILGGKLLGIPFFEHMRISFPRVFHTHVERTLSFDTSVTPLLVGIATFFMPCGFTQSMQLYTLSTGGFVVGGLTMLVFGLGTLPMLALMSVGSVSLAESRYASLFYKTAGLIVLAFAFLNIINSFVIIGLINPVFNF